MGESPELARPVGKTLRRAVVKSPSKVRMDAALRSRDQGRGGARREWGRPRRNRPGGLDEDEIRSVEGLTGCT